MKSLQRGYTVLKIYEIYHWDQTCQFSPETGDKGLFTDYINMFLKLKQEASGWPESVTSEQDIAKYLSDYKAREGIERDRESIQKNPALRTIAKLLLNSFWGKFGENLKKNKTSFLYDQKQTNSFNVSAILPRQSKISSSFQKI